MMRETWIWLLLLFAFLQGTLCVHKCYVCAPDIGNRPTSVTNLFGNASLPLCDNFNTKKEEFIKDCPNKTNVGCITEINGAQMSKTCSNFAINDCKIANKITYCYCKGLLCNSDLGKAQEETPTSRPLQAPPIQQPNDDEDEDEAFLEGSGGASTSTRKSNPKSTNSDLYEEKEIEDEEDITSTIMSPVSPKSYNSLGSTLMYNRPVLLVASLVSFCTFRLMSLF